MRACRGHPSKFLQVPFLKVMDSQVYPFASSSFKFSQGFENAFSVWCPREYVKERGKIETRTTCSRIAQESREERKRT